MSERVRDQYEAYPYPSRDPAEEARRLVVGSPSNLMEVNHYLYAGRRDFSRPFRALVAGGGTGDAAIMLAQQLSDAGQAGGRESGGGAAGGGEVVYLDLSQSSRAIAEARAVARGLTNLRFVTGSLLEAESLDLGVFDYIDCCGVLHHLADPAAGLAALSGLLKHDGGMGLMVYGTLGRNGVYPLQEMLRSLAGDRSLADQVALARRLLKTLPSSNLFARNPVLRDHSGSDAELVDLLLHSQDRAYLVEEVAALVEGAGLRLVSFIEPIRYDPATYVKDPVILKELSSLAPLERAAFAEKLAGNIKTHIFYASKNQIEDTVAAPVGRDAIPCLRVLEGPQLAKAVQRDLTLKGEFDGLSLQFALPRLAPAILPWVDGQTSLGRIQETLQDLDPRHDWASFKVQFDQLYGVLNGLNHLFIRYPLP
ncbi:bifunctional 2-polyprenyl-6-hydroxyphenol methylase/3-demethylubiquinol 3-O-methyltransferase UbiG [Pelagibius sp.]|uniref:class I SAM-dependent methyltransferase n=1 Tax=Pelagibius sp. TaxID=1931238 RepID=UPI0026287F9A|nr:class I SAM-dependent methyltransferase [Pelagibius sp.]